MQKESKYRKELEESSIFSDGKSSLDGFRSLTSSPLSCGSPVDFDRPKSPIFSLIDGYGQTMDYFTPSKMSMKATGGGGGRRRSSSLNSIEFLTMASSNLSFREHSPVSLSASRSLWVGNVDPTVTEKELRDLFAPHGNIESLRTLPAKECAFINYATVSEAKAAKEKLQGTALGNMIIRIGFGRAEAISRTTSFDGISASRALWIGNINSSLSIDELNDLFSKYGPIESSRILDGKSCAFINFFEVEHAVNAKKELSGTLLKNSIIKVGYAKTTAKKGESPMKESQHESDLFDSEKSYNTKSVCSRCLVRLAEIEVSPCGHDICHECSVKLRVDGKLLVDKDTICLVCSCNVLQYISVEGNEDFLKPIPPLPINKSQFDQGRLKDLKRRFDSSVSLREVEGLLMDLLPQAVDLSFDHIGNTIVQKMIEKGNDNYRLKLMEVLSPYMASLGIHKNGTWVIQKLVDFARTTEQRSCIANSIKPYLVALLHDQFGNYVIQCCLMLGSQNQFIVDGFCLRLLDIARNRFGARAMKSCLETAHFSLIQKKAVISHLMEKSLALVHDQNGIILIQWLLESDINGKYTFLVQNIRGHIPSLTLHKFGSAVIAKLVQNVEQSATEMIIDELFRDSVLNTLIQDPVSASILLKCLVTSSSRRPFMISKLRPLLNTIPAHSRAIHQTRLMEEITKNSLSVADESHSPFHSPLGSPKVAIRRPFPLELRSSAITDENSLFSGNIFAPRKNDDIWNSPSLGYRPF